MTTRAVLASTLLALFLAACGEQAATTAETPTDEQGASATPAVPEGTVYGAGVTDAPAVKIADIYADMESYDGKTVRVEGLVTGVCAKRGCWIRVADDEESKPLTFKVDDGVMVFPMSTQGKYAVAEGVVRARKLTLEQTVKARQHEAEEQGEEFDPKSVTEPMTSVRLAGLGAVVRDTK